MEADSDFPQDHTHCTVFQYARVQVASPSVEGKTEITLRSS